MLRFGPVLLAFLLTALPSSACSVPLFRFALEHWQPARYELIVYHRGPLSPADRDLVQRFEVAGQRANIRVSDADLDGRLDDAVRAVWNREGKDQSLPRIMLRYPESGPQIPSVWTGPLSADSPNLFDSPGRRAVFDGLSAGCAGVVILLLSGDGSADEIARALLRRELPRIAQGIKLPAPTDEGPQVISELPLRVEFPVVEVSRVASEELFVNLLLGSEAGLAKVKGPIAFPVFGRGRALCSLHGNDLHDPAELRRSMEFLCRECSCQVKELNPGVDLLIAANWDIVFEAERGPQPRTIALMAETRPSGGESPRAELRLPPPAGYSAVEVESGPKVSRSALLRVGTIAAACLVLLTGYWAMRGRHPTPPTT